MEVVVGAFLIILLIFMLCLGLYFFLDGIREGEGVITMLGAFLVCIVVIPIGVGVYEDNQKENSILTREEIVLTVSDKDHDSAWTQVISTGKTTSTIYHPEEWDISFTDGESTRAIDDEALFNSLELGDKVEGYRDTYTKENGEVFKIELKIKGYEGEN